MTLKAVRRYQRGPRLGVAGGVTHFVQDGGLPASLLVALRTVSRFNWVDNRSRTRTHKRGQDVPESTSFLFFAVEQEVFYSLRRFGSQSGGVRGMRCVCHAVHALDSETFSAFSGQQHRHTGPSATHAWPSVVHN